MRARRFGIGIATLALALAVAGPAAAHDITVSPSGGEVKHGWVGGLAPLPANGQGLFLGGPFGNWPLAAAHGKGLVDACLALQANPSVVDIRGPGGPGCPHGQ